MSSPATCRLAELEEQLAAQRQAIARFEAALWEGGFNDRLLASYQAAWRRLEALIAASATADRRHGFVLVIPVADSPRQLQACLASLLELCAAYGYGGRDAQGRWRKVSVLLADDSADPAVLAENRSLAETFAARGLRIRYFGPAEQTALLDRLADLDLAPIVGVHARPGFSHKGQAMMRNIAYLKLAEICAEEAEALGGPPLFYTLDADQTFEVKVATATGDAEVAALSFFHRLDEIFRDPGVRVLTGKVVGDPPVSPAVMAGNFLDDVIGFLAEMARTEPGRPYPRHIASTRGSGEAAYHDMADLFGFKASGETYRFRCGLAGTPDNAACFADFARRLNRFFHGEHPTRVTYYRHDGSGVVPARTVYTGNYVFRPEALDWFIPYAPLRLRMSGPSMGRLLKAELGAGFVSANLPMLHRRTLEATGQSEFRPGVVDRDAWVDLSDEFERQFHGDVLLFAMEHLTALGYPAATLTAAVAGEALDVSREDLRRRYADKQGAILERLARLESLLAEPEHWWNRDAADAAALACFHTFAANIRRNFGPDSPCQARLDDPGHRADWRRRQVAAILGLLAQRGTWLEALSRLQAGR
ncbi:MAG: hypothetical protein FD187_108 [bacterium]|nr:MAG: hypothetical protein FD142_1325 [bacterium]KAF0150676.1 MAG: hypothetical protein FD187_108 [bacterium]KAF0169529.1 MAG: hypothetical protein FD158_362 [bacterium]TXT22456.1 MAG: hypothetical protein FD132_411 [bacterium]